MLGGKLRYFEMVFAFMFGEMESFHISDRERIKHNLVKFLAKLDVKSAKRLT